MSSNKPLTKLEAARLLITMDHVYLSPEGAQRIAEPFGINLTPQRVKANTGAFKGLEVSGAKRGEAVSGYDARDLAYMIARHENVDFPPMFGRGSGLRAAAGAVIDALEKQEQDNDPRSSQAALARGDKQRETGVAQ